VWDKVGCFFYQNFDAKRGYIMKNENQKNKENKPKIESPYLTLNEFGAYFKISRQTVWKLIIKRKVKGIHIDGAHRWIIPKSEVENYAKACETHTRKDYFARGNWFNNR
jgi:excisionase family DNA binding protein